MAHKLEKKKKSKEYNRNPRPLQPPKSELLNFWAMNPQARSLDSNSNDLKLCKGLQPQVALGARQIIR